MSIFKKKTLKIFLVLHYVMVIFVAQKYKYLYQIYKVKSYASVIIICKNK